MSPLPFLLRRNRFNYLVRVGVEARREEHRRSRLRLAPSKPHWQLNFSSVAAAAYRTRCNQLAIGMARPEGRDPEEFVRRVKEAIQAEAWVVDDNCRMPSWRRGRRSGRSAVRSRQIPGHHERFSGSRRHVELTCSNSWRKSTAGLSR
jgi:hypothetical protein